MKAPFYSPRQMLMYMPENAWCGCQLAICLPAI